MMRPIHVSLALLALAGCQAQQDEAPWNTYPGIDGHARYLPLAGTSHQPSATGPIRCEDCHTTPSTFTQFDCIGCHAQAPTTSIHTPAGTTTPIAQYAWTTADCMKCHPQGGISDAAHGVFFPIGQGARHPRTCRPCHPDPLDKQSLTGPAAPQCVLCHSDPFTFPGLSLAERHLHATEPTKLPVLDYPLAPAARDCLRCHDQSQVDRIALHGLQPGPAGSGGPGQIVDGLLVHDSHCFNCHSGPASVGLPSRPWAQNWKVATCKPCH
jgi:hypothetical protein